jgi:AraC family transcriptional regulator
MEREIVPPDDDGPIRFVTRATSADRWSGFEARVADTSGGYAESTGSGGACLSMSVGAPIVATCRCDGTLRRRFQVAGDIDILSPGLSAAWQDTGPTTMLIVKFEMPLIRTAAQGLGVDPDRVSIIPQMHVRDQKIEHIGWALKAELESAEPLGRLYGESLGLALAAHLLRRYGAIVPRRIARGLSKRRLQRVTDYIHDHLARDLSLAELARLIALSPSHFKVLFKESVGMPVHQYVIRKRVECAVNLLAAGTLPLADVALQSGFSNQSHMALCVRRVTSMTPKAIRDAI